MSTLKASTDPVAGTITITIDDASRFVRLVRSDVNGSRPVRRRANQGARAGELVLVDYEPSLSGLIQYQLIETGGVASEPLWTTFGGEARLPRFILPSVPQFFVTVDTVHGYSSARKSRATLHTVINRNDAIVAEGRLTPRRGRLEIFCSEYMHGKNLENLLERGQAALYRQAENPGQDMYFYVDPDGGTSFDPDGAAWRLTVDYVEVDFPSGDVISGENWTFDTLAKTGTSFDAVAGSYRSFVDLAIGQKAVGS